MDLVLTEGAERDINAAAVWYEGERSGLGRRFLDAVGVALAHIEDNPQQFPVVHRDKPRAAEALSVRVIFPDRVDVCGGGRLFPRAPKPNGVEISPIVSSEAVSSGGWSLTGHERSVEHMRPLAALWRFAYRCIR